MKFKSVRKSVLNSLVLITLFILPYLVTSDISLRNVYLVYYMLIGCYIFLGLFMNKYLFNKEYRNVLFFTLMFVFFGVINQIINGYFSYFNLLAPLIAYLGYVFTHKNKLEFKVFNILIVSNYIYFIIVYYSKLSSFFLRIDDETDGLYFLNTSSNLIPCVLIINLFAYDIISKIKYENKNDKIITIYAAINVLLILIQQSRAGIIISIIYLLIKLFSTYRKFFWVTAISFMIFIIINLSFIIAYSDIIGGISKESDYLNDARGLQAKEFFTRLDVSSFFWGYGKTTFTASKFSSVQNQFLSIWNYYTFFTVFIFIVIIILRFILKDKYKIPFIYFIPFIIYGMFEGFYFPNFWDFSIYLMLFIKKEPQIGLPVYANSNSAIVAPNTQQ
ncbi:MAG: hypothetical protein C0397_03665 [Odoribacter sp.]|nr:hypothetical protein [Odoribacter sp.]